MKYANKQGGFTLIELVIVIVILGILAATAAPKFIDIQGDARGATMNAVKASVESATAIIHSKALIAGKTVGAATLSVNGGTNNVDVDDGWPVNTATTWANLLDLESTDFSTAVTGTSGSSAEIVWYPTSLGTLTVAQVKAAECYVSYVESTSSNTKPAITIDIDKC